jgi:hypothetical protein
MPGFPDALLEAFRTSPRRNQARDRYRRFFDLYFTLRDDKFSRRFRAPPSDADQEELWLLPREPPYDNGLGWRDVGVTSDIIGEVCNQLGRPLEVIHNKTCIWDFYPEDWHELDRNRQAREQKMLRVERVGNHATLWARRTSDVVHMKVRSPGAFRR